MGKISDIYVNRRESPFGFFYLMTVGVLLAWVMVAGIIDTTIFERNHFASLIRIFFIVGLFGLFFLHKYFTRVGIVLFVGVAVFVASGFLFVPDELAEPNFANRFAQLISRTAQFVTGTRPYTLAYETVITWALSLFFGFFVVFFSYRKFRFWILFATSVATTSLAITSSYFRDIRIFYTYAFCILALVIKYLHEKNISKMANPPQRTTFIKVVVPVVAGVVLVASTIPRPPTLISGGNIRSFLRTPFDFVNEMFLNITHQSEFSLRQIGFGESGGRLGGDIEANDRVFMRINSNTAIVHPLYLTGATRDTYTGYSWENLYNDYQSVDFDVFEQNIEVAERILSVDFEWLQSQIEVVESGRLVQADVYELIADPGFYWLDEAFDDIDNVRIFIEEEADFMMFVHVDSPSDWYVDFNDNDLFNPSDGGRIEIDNLDRRLTSIFHTGIVRNVDAPHTELSFIRNRDGRLLSEQRLSSNTIYAIYYYTDPYWFHSHHNLNFSARGILQDINDMLALFRQSYGYEFTHTRFNVDGNLISYEDLLNYYLIPRADEIYEIYTALPDDFPERVHELALEVTADATSDYRKMRLLETFLSENFAYTLTPGPSPTDQDFVDHFLFDLEQGYCVHFATAFVTMARSLGIPTRYVEGFHVNATGATRGEDIYVYNRMAHAWPEVYFEGYGWHQFEPTPASGLAEQQEGGSTSSSGTGGSWPNPENWGVDVPNFYPDWTPSGEGSASGGGQSSGLVDDMGLSVWTWIGVIILLIVIIIFVRVAFVLWRNSSMRKKDNNEIAIYRFKVLLSYLRFLGFEIKDTETANQFTTRIRNSFSKLDFEKEMLYSASEVFTKARYSKHDITDIECNTLEKIIYRLDLRMQLQLGRWRYFIYRYILAKV